MFYRTLPGVNFITIAIIVNLYYYVCLSMLLKFSLFSAFICLLGISASAQHHLLVKAAAEAEKKVLEKFSLPSGETDSAMVQGELRRLLNRLQEEGYLLASVSGLTFTPDSAIAFISTGSQFKWALLKPQGVEERWLNRTSWRRKSFTNKPFRYHEAARLLRELPEQAENGGYPFAAARLDSVKLENNMLEAHLRLDKGPLIVFDTIVLEGKSSISPRFLAAHLGIKPGEPYNHEKAEAAADRLGNLPYIRLQEAPKISFQNEQATLYLRLNDKKANILDGIIGLLPDPEKEGKMMFTGQFDLQLQNPFGGGKDIGLHWQRLNRNSQNLEASYLHPYLFGSAMSLFSGFSLLKEEEKFVNRQLDLEARFRHGIHNMLKVLVLQKDSRLLTGATETGYGSFRLSQLGLGFSRTRLQNPMLPRRGYSLSFSFLGGEKDVRSLPNAAGQGTALPGKSMQYRVQGDLGYYIPLGRHIVWAHQLQTGMLSGKNLFINDLFRPGGLSSLRGFREKSFFVSDYALSRLELRYLAGEETFLFLFYDQAWMEQPAGNLHVNDWPLGFGTGLSLGTNSGTFNFVYGLGKAESQPLNFSQSQVHFGYVNRF